MGGSESVVDVYRSEVSQRLSELLDGLRVSYKRRKPGQLPEDDRRYTAETGQTFGLFALRVLGRALLLGVEPQVLKKEDLSVLALRYSLLSLLSDTIREEGNGSLEERLDLLGLYRWQKIE